jgi:TRAP-type uncharacterized transport system fused permease subunit
MVAHGDVLLPLSYAIIASLVLGISLPTISRVVTSAIAAPAVIVLTVQVLAAHLFLFYFGIIADLMVALVLRASGRARSAQMDSLKAGFTAKQLAIASFLLLSFAVYTLVPPIIDALLCEIAWVITLAIIGIMSSRSAFDGYGYMLTHVLIGDRRLFGLDEVHRIEPSLLTHIIRPVILAYR